MVTNVVKAAMSPMSAVPVAPVHDVDLPHRSEEWDAIGDWHEAGQALDEVLAVDEEIQRESEDHEHREARARKAADEIDDLVAVLEEAGCPLGGVPRRLNRLVGVQLVGGARVLQLVDVGWDLLLQGVRPVRDCGNERDREEQDCSRNREKGECGRQSSAHSSAHEDPNQRLDREGEEPGGDEPDDRLAYEPDADQ
jgi:hypothetical protein